MNNSTLPPTANTTAAPIHLAHYEVMAAIGRGGMGLVYRARDTRLDRLVAIKCLRTELFEAHYIERFKREALLLAKLNHPNIVQIYDFIEAPDQLALVMELVEGDNLQIHLHEHIVPVLQRMQWLIQITQGLAVAHDAGIIHRDLKPENILINKRKQAKITDLGIAKSQDFNGTLTDHVAGSYCSMSPEQAMGETINFKSDLFSLGILAYQLLCGAHPFGDTNNKLQIMQRIISHPPTPPSKHNPDLPPDIIHLLGQLLSKNPENRPDNTHWVAAQFMHLSSLINSNNDISDDTQALMPNTTAANQTINATGKNSRNTQDHPTFETRFVGMDAPRKPALWLRVKNHLIDNRISVGLGTLSVLILAAVVVWQLQPKPPKYIAVIAPKLTAEGMQESQQELVKGAVYDAIQQSVIQLEGYYLIPQSEVAESNGDNETILDATAADELITTTIQCPTEACSVTITRLASDTTQPNGRLGVTNSTSIDILTDNFLSVAEIVQNSIGSIYAEKLNNNLAQVAEDDYSAFLSITIKNRESGPSYELLHELESLQKPLTKQAAAQNLYREIALDLYLETKNTTLLDRLEAYIKEKSSQKKNLAHLNNLYRLQIAKRDFTAADTTIAELTKLNIGSAAANELFAYKSLAKNDYASSIKFYRKALDSKKTANNYYNLATVYWYTGDNVNALKALHLSLELAPNFYKSHNLNGLIFLFMGNIKSASESFEKAISQNPNDVTNLNNLGLCYLLLEKHTEALAKFSQALQLAPEKNTIKLNLADTENLSGNTVAANKLYKEIINSIDESTTNAEDLRNLSQSYAHIGSHAKSLKSLQELVKVDPQNIETIYSAALVHMLAQNYASAKLNIEAAIDNGMHMIWFTFPWFDLLCEDRDFQLKLQQWEASDRCLTVK